MNVFFVLNKVKIKNVLLKHSKDGKEYLQLSIVDNKKVYNSIFIFSDRFENFDNICFDSNSYYRISGKIFSKFGKQLFSVSKIIPICENNKLDNIENYEIKRVN